MNSESKFWMVYGMGQGAPTVRHHAEEHAVAEAKRLSRSHPGIRFFVLASVRGFQLADPVAEIAISDPEDLPW